MPRGSIRIGTCSWAEKSLIESGTFYPPEVTTAEQRLRFYALHFDTVEVDSSFYAIPTPHMVSAWVERTPPGFLFHLKAPGAFTGHSIDAAFLPQELRDTPQESKRETGRFDLADPEQLRKLAAAFTAALRPLREARRLGFVIFQFPPWFCYKKANLEYLQYLKELMGGLPIAVEFRHGSWLTRQHADSLFEFMRQHNISYIACDEPQFGNLSTAPLVPGLTSCMAYLRLHGRNAENWLTHDTPRYNYLNSQDELRSFARLALRLVDRARQVFFMFNNSFHGHAAQNALTLKRIMERN